MAKEPELMISVQAGEFPAGTRLTSDDPEVRAHPRIWVRFAEGHRAIFRRRLELEREAEAQAEANVAALREERIRQGTRSDPSDDIFIEAAKRAVRENSDLELVHDPITGAITGARPKQKAPRTDSERQEALTAARRGGYLAD